MTEQTKGAKWTPEPWEVRVWDGDQWPERRVSLAVKDGEGLAVSARFATTEQAHADLSRAAACVNALQGIANPSAVSKLIKAAQEAHNGLRNIAQHFEHARPDARGFAEELRLALAALEQEKQE